MKKFAIVLFLFTPLLSLAQTPEEITATVHILLTDDAGNIIKNSSGKSLLHKEELNFYCTTLATLLNAGMTLSTDDLRQYLKDCISACFETSASFLHRDSVYQIGGEAIVDQVQLPKAYWDEKARMLELVFKQVDSALLLVDFYNKLSASLVVELSAEEMEK